MTLQERPYERIGRALYRYQSALRENGTSLRDYIERRYLQRWESDGIYRVMAIRTALMSGMQEFLVKERLLNLERVQMSLVTDPLAHDVEHVPSFDYKGHPYVATHSMIYSKFLACHNPHLRGVFVDSPNIRLEVEMPDRAQPGKYLADFSQLDVEVRRNRGVTQDDYYDRPAEVGEILRSDWEEALRFFEGMVRAGVGRALDTSEEHLEALGVRLEVPDGPFPVFPLDEAVERHGRADVEAKLGAETGSPFFWVGGLMRENYDLIYPYLRRDGTRRTMEEFTSREIYNFDLCARSLPLTGASTPAREVLSGAVREWLPDPIVARLLDNRVIPKAPIFRDGEIENIDELGGYGPFLMVACRRDEAGQPTFPETFGGGIGVERFLWSILRGPVVETIEDVTCFGKNPDGPGLYLF
jgi:aspartyl/asparaginyl-tRNA synthetase